MICKIVSDSSCDLRMSEFDGGEIRFETVPLRLQVGEREFIDNDALEIPQLISSGIVSGGMIPKLECCVDALNGGVGRIHLLDGRIPHSILIELLSNQGIGTMLHKEF